MEIQWIPLPLGGGGVGVNACLFWDEVEMWV